MKHQIFILLNKQIRIKLDETNYALAVAEKSIKNVVCRIKNDEKNLERTISNNTSSIVSKVWSFCNPLRDVGVGYGDYLEQLTYLLFLKIADEYKPPHNRKLNMFIPGY